MSGADDPLRRLRRQRNARAVHGLGPRTVFELIDEIAKHHPSIADDFDRRLARYAALDPAALRAAGGDGFAPLPLRSIGGAR
jgi:hypothetical protein